jgi:hypothetical protein
VIVSAPTALYESVLPREEQDDQSVTFVISSTDPPRSEETLFQLLRSEELKSLPPRIFTRKERRLNLGNLIFRVSTGTQSQVGSGTKTFEVGQILNFGDVVEPGDISDLNVPKVVELQQNTNKLDLEGLGLTDEEVDSLVGGAEDKLEDAVQRLNQVKTSISDTEAAIQTNQKTANEAKKAREAAQAVFATVTNPTEGNEIIEKLENKEDELAQERDVLITELNVLNESANEIYEEILDLREVVR